MIRTKNNKIGDLTLPDFRTYFKAIVVKRVIRKRIDIAFTIKNRK
jgi:hypothetical protein